VTPPHDITHCVEDPGARISVASDASIAPTHIITHCVDAPPPRIITHCVEVPPPHDITHCVASDASIAPTPTQDPYAHTPLI